MEWVGVFFAFCVGLWVAGDAEKRGKSKGAAFLWFLGTWMLLIVFWPVWLLTRPKLPSELPIVRFQSEPQLCCHCGKYYDRDPIFCPNCGQSLKQLAGAS
jgi:hypothetical protein